MRICFQSFFTKRTSKQASLNYVSHAIQNFIITRYPSPITKTLALTIERSHTACNVDNLYIILIYNNNELSFNLNEKSQYCKIVSWQAYLY